MIPKLLLEISNPPETLHVLGALPPDDIPKIAVVGTRKASDYGRGLAREISRDLASAGLVIVSGLAMGIDTAVHEGCLEAGGKTIAVLACGVDKIYPAQNKSLADKIIASGGAIVSEFPDGTPPYKNNFLVRNRIISGLSLATVIIEAPFKSGAVSTAGHAADQGREVFVVPGPVNHPGFGGSHLLIRDGGRLVSSARDILEDLGLIAVSPVPVPLINSFSGNPLASAIVKFIGENCPPVTLEQLIVAINLSPEEILRTLSRLIIEGVIKESSGGYSL
jgi:DNA processing protein